MAEPSRPVVSTICREMSIKSQVFSLLKVWAVVPEVFLPHLSYQMSVLAECLLMAFSSTLCEEVLSLATLNWGAPQELPWDVASLRGKISIGFGE